MKLKAMEQLHHQLLHPKGQEDGLRFQVMQSPKGKLFKIGLCQLILFWPQLSLCKVNHLSICTFTNSALAMQCMHCIMTVQTQHHMLQTLQNHGQCHWVGTGKQCCCSLSMVLKCMLLIVALLCARCDGLFRLK